MENQKLFMWQLTIEEGKQMITDVIKNELVNFFSEDKDLKNNIEMLSLKDAALFLNVSTETLHRWNRINYLKKFFMGGKPCYKKSDLIAVKTGQTKV